jgi:hypothetical protein
VTGRRVHTHDTYVVLVPSAGTVRPRCSCGWAGSAVPVRDFFQTTNEEIEHLAVALAALEPGLGLDPTDIVREVTGA